MSQRIRIGYDNQWAYRRVVLNRSGVVCSNDVIPHNGPRQTAFEDHLVILTSHKWKLSETR